MRITEAAALLWTQRLLASALFLQTLELLWIRPSFRPEGIWSWKALAPEFEVLPRALRPVVSALLEYRGFVALLLARLGAAAALGLATCLPWAPACLASALLLFLLVSSVLVCARWRGTFNGGSDYMTLIVLQGAWVATTWSESAPGVSRAALAYVAVQCCLSYFVAGAVKLRRAEWRSGQALASFLRNPAYGVSPGLQAVVSSSTALAVGLSWGVMAFECAFPLSLLRGDLCAAFAGMALLFHLLNARVLGLSRFVLAWASSYPALLCVSQGWLRGP